MKISKQALNLIGVTYTEYLEWCAAHNKKHFSKKVILDFFTRIKDGRIIRKNGILVSKHRTGEEYDN